MSNWMTPGAHRGKEKQNRSFPSEECEQNAYEPSGLTMSTSRPSSSHAQIPQHQQRMRQYRGVTGATASSSNLSNNNNEQETFFGKMGMHFPHVMNHGQKSNVGHQSVSVPSLSYPSLSAMNDSKETQTIDDLWMERLGTQQSRKQPLPAELDRSQLELLAGGNIPPSLLQQGALSGMRMPKKVRTGELAASDILSFELHLHQQAMLRQQQDKANSLLGMPQWTPGAVLQEKIEEGRRELQKLQEEIHIRELLRVREQLLMRKQQQEEQLVTAAQQARLQQQQQQQQHKFVPSIQEINHLQALRQRALMLNANSSSAVTGRPPHMTPGDSINVFGGQEPNPNPNQEDPNILKKKSSNASSDANNASPPMHSITTVEKKAAKSNSSDDEDTNTSNSSCLKITTDNLGDTTSSLSMSNTNTSNSSCLKITTDNLGDTTSSLSMSNYDSDETKSLKNASAQVTTEQAKKESTSGPILNASNLKKNEDLISKAIESALAQSKSVSLCNKALRVPTPKTKDSILQGKAVKVPNPRSKNISSRNVSSYNNSSLGGDNITDFNNKSTSTYTSHSKISSVGRNTSDMVGGKPTNAYNVQTSLSAGTGKLPANSLIPQIHRGDQAGVNLKNESNTKYSTTKNDPASIKDIDPNMIPFVKKGMFQTKAFESQVEKYLLSHINTSASSSTSTSSSSGKVEAARKVPQSISSSGSASSSGYKVQTTSSSSAKTSQDSQKQQNRPTSRGEFTTPKASSQSSSEQNDDIAWFKNRPMTRAGQAPLKKKILRRDKPAARSAPVPVKSNKKYEKLSVETMTDSSLDKRLRYFNDGNEVSMKGAPVTKNIPSSSRKTVQLASKQALPVPKATPVPLTAASRTSHTSSSQSSRKLKPQQDASKKRKHGDVSASNMTKEDKSQSTIIPKIPQALNPTNSNVPSLRLACSHNDIMSFVQDHVPELAFHLFEIQQRYQKAQEGKSDGTQANTGLVSPFVVDAVLEELYKLVAIHTPTEIAKSPNASSYYEQLRIRAASCVRTMEIIKRGLAIFSDASKDDNIAFDKKDDIANTKIIPLNKNEPSTSITNNKNRLKINSTIISDSDKPVTTMRNNIGHITKRNVKDATNVKPPQEPVKNSRAVPPRIPAMKLSLINKKGSEHLKQLQEQQRMVWNFFGDQIDAKGSQEAAMEDQDVSINTDGLPYDKDNRHREQNDQQVALSSREPSSKLPGPRSDLTQENREVLTTLSSDSDRGKATKNPTQDVHGERERAMNAARALLNFGTGL